MHERAYSSVKIILGVVSIMFGEESGDKQTDFRVDLIKLGNVLDSVVKF